MPAPTAITIYPQYYLKAIGTWLRMVEHWLAIHGKKLWMDRTGDIKLVYWPHSALGKLDDFCFEPLPKQGALNFLKIFCLPAMGLLLIFT